MPLLAWILAVLGVLWVAVMAVIWFWYAYKPEASHYIWAAPETGVRHADHSIESVRNRILTTLKRSDHPVQVYAAKPLHKVERGRKSGIAIGWCSPIDGRLILIDLDSLVHWDQEGHYTSVQLHLCKPVETVRMK
jgi:hypothetical protein